MAKLRTGTDSDQEAAYALHVVQLAERRARDLAGLNSDIAKIEKDHEVAAAVLKRDRVVQERLEQERVAKENFAIEKKRRLDRLSELERDKPQPSGKFGQGGGDRDRDMKGDRERDLHRDSRTAFGQGDYGRKKTVAESDRSDREREVFFNREQRDGRSRDSNFGSDDRKLFREERVDDYDRGGRARDFNSKANDLRRSSRDHEDDRRERSSRDEDRDGDDRRGRLPREDRDPPGDRHLRAESLKMRCAFVQGRHGNTVEEAMANERGAGILQTLAGVIAENRSTDSSTTIG